MTQLEIIKRYLGITHNGEWVKEGLIRSIRTDWGNIGFRGDRDCRQMVHDGILEKRKVGRFTEVRYTGYNDFMPSRKVALPPAREKQEQRLI